MDAKTLQRGREALKAKRDEYKAIMDIAAPDGGDLDHEATGLSKAAGRKFENGGQLVDFLQEGFKELDEMQEEQTKIEDIAKGSATNDAALKAVIEGIKHPVATKDFKDPYGVKGYTAEDVATFKGRTAGEAILEALLKQADGDGLYSLKNGKETEVMLPQKMVEDMLLKTTMTTSAGWDPEDIRLPGFYGFPTRPAPVVADVIPTFPTTMSTIKYMLETTFTNNAAEAAENANAAESALAYTETSDEVRKIIHTLPVTQEQLDDVPGMRAIIDQRLGFMLRQRLDLQLLSGDGSAPNISGFHDRSGIGSQAKGGDSDVVACRKAINNVESSGFAFPNAFIFHPTDWMNIRLTQTADGNFLFGPPSQVGAETLWGLSTVRTTAQTITQALVGDFNNYSALYMRKGVTISITDSHASEYIKDVLRLKAQMRAALAVFRVTAFSEVTGL